ncbi:hypothetical protein EYF80_022473 [Liparis tanakae]|uniref:Uncharacterized protein n=1 Tax=Liparis tanakae TaxID=230148 RepID=A0A4Z2HND3_9TELE|nr:hypothetical protein EYF80_022473 [Liparis tanakae]
MPNCPFREALVVGRQWPSSARRLAEEKLFPFGLPPRAPRRGGNIHQHRFSSARYTEIMRRAASGVTDAAEMEPPVIESAASATRYNL